MSHLARTAALECQVKDLEERLHTLEKSWRSAMETERREHQKQLAEVVQIIMVQEQLHSERVTALESRLADAVNLCHTAVACTRHAALPPASADDGDRQASLPTAPSLSPTTSHEDPLPVAIPAAYQSRIDRIFDFYTSGDPLRPLMGMQDFCRLLRDCKIGLVGSGTSPELLWMTVMRALHGGTGGRLPADEASSRFSHQRLETFGREKLSQALAVVATEMHKLLLSSVDTPAAQNALAQSAQDTLLIFLTGVVFPRTAEVMRRSVSALGAPAGDAAVTTELQDAIRSYGKDEGVKAVLRKHAPSIRRTFEQALSSPTQRAVSTAGMTIEALADVVRRFKLLPHLSKADIRAIFDCCVAWERSEDAPSSGDAPSAYLGLPGFIKALCCISERVYGDTAVASLYPTPASRVKKLMTKMFVLP